MCFKAAIDAAVQLINEDDTILKGFELKMEYLDNYVSIVILLSQPPWKLERRCCNIVCRFNVNKQRHFKVLCRHIDIDLLDF